MNEKFKKIESKEEFFTEVAIATGRKYDSVKNNWFYPSVRVPEKFEEVVNLILDKRLEYQKALKQLHEKYFGI